MSFLTTLLTTAPVTTPLLPTPPDVSTPNELMHGAIDFFSLWIGRIGGIIAIIGFIKFALGIKSDNAQEMLSALLTAVSGFIIMEYVSSTFTITGATADSEFYSIMKFTMKWIRRIGAAAMLLGSISFGLSIRDHNASTKVSALKTIAAGGVTIAVSGIWKLFI